MSTKVYNGYELRTGRSLHDFARWIRSMALPVAEQRLARIIKSLVVSHVDSQRRAEARRLMADLHAQVFGRDAVKPTARELEKPFTPFDAGEFVRLNYLAQFGTRSRNLWHLETEVSAWDVGGKILMRAWEDNMSALNASLPVFGLKAQPPMTLLLDLPKARPWVKDCSFWDDSDKPRSISAREWARRRQLWDEQDGNRDSFLALPILDRQVVERLCGMVATTPVMHRFWKRERRRYPKNLLEGIL